MSSYSIEIFEENKNITKKLISNISTEKNRKRAYISLIAIESFMEYCQNNDLQAQKSESLSSCPVVLDNYDIADITVNNKKIDIRTIVSDEFSCLIIPRNHVLYGFTPDIYVAAKLNKEVSTIEFIGFLNKAELTNFNGDKNHVIIDKSYLHPIEELKETLDSIKPITFFSIPAEHHKAKSLFLSFLENIITVNDKDYLIRHLAKCASCRKEFNDFYKMETTLKKFNDKNFLKLAEILNSPTKEISNNLNLTAIPLPVILPVAVTSIATMFDGEFKLEENFESNDDYPIETIEEYNLETAENTYHEEIQEFNLNEEKFELNDTYNEEIQEFNLNDENLELNDTYHEEIQEFNLNEENFESNDTYQEEIQEFNLNEENLELNDTYQEESLTSDHSERLKDIEDSYLDKQTNKENDFSSENVKIELSLNENQINDEEMELPSLDNINFDDENDDEIDENYLKIDKFDDCSLVKYDLNDINLSEKDLTEIENSFVGSLLSDFSDQYPSHLENDQNENNVNFSTLEESNNFINSKNSFNTMDLIDNAIIEENTLAKAREDLERNAVDDMLSSLDDIEFFETLDSFEHKEEHSDTFVTNMFIPELSDDESNEDMSFKDAEIENLINIDNERNKEKEYLIEQKYKKATMKKYAIVATITILALSTFVVLSSRNSLVKQLETPSNLASITPQPTEMSDLNPINPPVKGTSTANAKPTQSDIVPSNPNNINSMQDSTSAPSVNPATARIIKQSNLLIKAKEVKWEIGESLANNERLKSYLLFSSKMLRLSITKSLVGIKDQKTSGRIKIMTVFDLEGKLRYSAILESSGSHQIDSMTLKALKENFALNKIPKVETTKEYIKMNSVILF